MASLHHPMLAYDDKDLNDDYARDVFFFSILLPLGKV